jgi:hypothetical protein
MTRYTPQTTAIVTKQSKHELKRLVEQSLTEVGRFQERGVWLCVDEVESTGKPVEAIEVWATLHFLPQGSPFDSDDPDLWVWPLNDQLEAWIGHAMGLSGSVTVKWRGLNRVIHDGVRFEGNGGHRIS